MPKNKTLDILYDIVKPVVDKLNFELVDIEYKKEGKDWYLRVYIDKDGGITIDDCQMLSEILSEKLDEKDPINHSYILEVSSPGLDRPLKKDKDFEKFKGRKINIKLFEALNGRKEFTGTLKDFDGINIVILDANNNLITIPKEKTSSVRLEIEF